MMRASLRILLLVASAAFSAQAGAQPASAGRAVAEKVCAECHQVEPGMLDPLPGKTAPAFAAIAKMASTTDLSIKVFLRTSHHPMPNLLLSEADTNAITSYIASMKAK